MKNTACTLLEIVVAMLILSLVTAGAFGLFVSSHRLIIDAKQRLQAVNQATKVLENLRMRVCTDSRGNPLNRGDRQPPTLINLPALPSFDSGVTGTSWDYSVALADSSPLTNKRVSVRIGWSE